MPKSTAINSTDTIYIDVENPTVSVNTTVYKSGLITALRLPYEVFR